MSNLLEKASILLTPTAYDDGKVLSVKPEDGTGDFDFTRNSSATRVNSQGLIEDVQILSSNLVSNGDFSQEGSELVTNGDFSNGANNWSLGTGWSIGVGKVIGSSASGTLSQAGIASAGKQYKVTFSVTDYSSGTLYIDIGGSSAQTTTSNGLKTFYFTSTSTGSLRFYGGSFTGSIDNVSVKEVGQDWTLGASWSIGNNKATRLTSVDWGLDQTISSAVTGRTYRVTTEITDYTSGELRLALGSGGTVNVIGNALGVYVNEFVWDGSSGSIIRFQGNFVGSISNITILEITDDTNLPRINYEGFSYQDALGSEEVVNGGFDTNLNNWVAYSNTLISWESGGYALLDSNNNFWCKIRQSNVFEIGKTYKVILTAKSDRTDLSFHNSPITGSFSQADTFETFEQYYTATTTDFFFGYANAGSSTITIDNVSVKEVLGQEVVPGSGCGSWLFEPQSTNLIPYSETLGNNTNSGGISFTYNNSISPDGTQNAALVSVTSANDRLQPSFAAVNSLVAISIFLKHNGTDFSTQINTFNTGTGTLFGARAHVTATDVTFTSYSGGFDSASFVDYGNGWFRVIVVCQSTTGTTLAQWRPTTVSGTLSYPCFGFQVEQQSFATSYVPTNGSTVTRLKDAAFGAGNSSLINSTEGVLYVEVAALAEQTLTRYITLSDGTSSNRIIIYITDVGVIKFFVGVGGVTQAAKTVTGQTTTNFNKLAVSYKQNDMKFYLNGVEVHTDTSALTYPTDTLNVINFAASNGTSSPFFGKANCLAVFKEALTDAELTCLTTI